jgi:hypothetical protein
MARKISTVYLCTLHMFIMQKALCASFMCCWLVAQHARTLIYTYIILGRSLYDLSCCSSNSSLIPSAHMYKHLTKRKLVKEMNHRHSTNSTLGLFESTLGMFCFYSILWILFCLLCLLHRKLFYFFTYVLLFCWWCRCVYIYVLSKHY